MPIITNLQKNFNNKNKTPKSKIVGVVLLAFATIGYVGLFIKRLTFLHNFLLGTFGLFSYVLFLMLYIIGGALVKGEKYVYSKKYIVYLCMTLVSTLAVFHIAFTFNMQLSSYGEYLSQIYTSGVSVGGVLLGIIIYPLQKFLYPLGSLFLFLIVLAISIWLIYDYLTRVRYIKKQDTKIFNKKVEKIKQDKVKSSVITIQTDQPRPNVKIGLDAELEKEQTARQQALEKLGIDKSVRSERFVDGKTLNSFATDFVNDKPKIERPTDYSGTFGYNLMDSKKSKSKSSNYEKNLEFLEATLSGSAHIQNVQNDLKQTSNSDVTMQDFLTANFGDSVQAEQTFPNKQALNDYSTSFSNQNSGFSIDNQNESVDSTINQFNQPYSTALTNNTDNNSILQENLDDANKNIDETNSQTDQQDELTKSIEQKLDDVKTNDAGDIDFKTFTLPPKLVANSSRRRGLKFNENQTDMFVNNVTSQQQEPKKPHVFKPYVPPTVNLLSQIMADETQVNEDCEVNSLAIEQTLESFGVPAKVNNITIGPAVTRYELTMPVGITVKSVIKYADDISAAVKSVKGVRVQAPIPGKNAVGVEVPNKKVQAVGLREILESKEFLFNKNALSYAVGKEVSGKAVVADMHDMPHMLVAGSTGSGKSVALNTIIISLIYKYGPEDLRFLLVDPKQVEFYMYNGLPHLLLPEAIIDPNKAVSALDWAIDEMERRYSLMRDSGVREIMEYLDLPEVKSKKKEKFAHIVVIIDEFGDIMSLGSVKKDIEEKVRRLAQKGRAAGINLILATQRPSVDVITGVIKNNLPSRMAFAVQNFQDSRTILDTGGAEKLLGKGDMLFSPRGAEPYRVQGCFISTKEIRDVVDFIKQNNESFYDEEIEKAINKNSDSSQSDNSYELGENSTGYDPLIPKALKLVIQNGCASASMLQRRFSIGNPKAARIIDQMEEHKFISGPNGSKPRTVYITAEQFKELFGEDIDD